MQLVFLHGLETGPHGNKYQALKAMFGEVLSPDCEGIKDPQQRLRIIRHTFKDQPGPFIVVGSSAGGLMALLLQKEEPRVAGLVLCAPALHNEAAQGLTAESLPPTVVIHGRQDDVVPIESSRCFGAPLIEVDDGHRLSASLPLMLREVFNMKLALQFPAMVIE
ncbi:MAG: alpha/beta hydrolase [Thermodesulfobacteriota bacterium]|nr:alpha/beta hydrolase [Thermodesulfobacteriota bacterium]